MAETDFIDDKSIAPDRTAPDPREIERLAWLSEFERTWYPVLELKPWHKRDLKEYTAKKQKQEGTTVVCERCGKLCGFDGTQIHHPDHNERNNALCNIRVYCNLCNNDEKKQWLRQCNRRNHAVDATLLHLKKENETESLQQTADEILQEQLLKKAPTTFQKSVHYKKQSLAYLLEYVKERKSFEDAVADVEVLAGCSHSKAIEYLNGYSLSAFAPYRQWSDKAGQWIAPRQWTAEAARTVEYQEAQKALEEQVKHICVRCSKPFIPSAKSTARTCDTCMGGESS